MENKFDWSDSGLQLLSEINIRIESYGGRRKLLEDIENEQLKFTQKPVKKFFIFKQGKKYRAREVMFIIQNHKKLTYKEIAIKLNRSDYSVTHKIKRMLDSGILNSKSI